MDKNRRNSRNKNSLPLHKRTHWHNLRSAIFEMSVYEKVDLSAYDTSNITCYTCSGDELKGKNVTFTASDSRSCWVSNNNYEMFEIPAKNNPQDYSFAGDFLFLSHNTSYDYWVFGDMKASIDFDHAKNYSILSEKYTINPYGKYIIIAGEGENIIHKECNEYDVMFGMVYGRYKEFDAFGTRKKAYIGKTKPKIISSISKNNGKSIVSNDKVKIYKKKKKRQQ